jgi:hypothetical protein
MVVTGTKRRPLTRHPIEIIGPDLVSLGEIEQLFRRHNCVCITSA